ncbi:MAG: hypothetical protein H7839_19060 [Magnetococcus sp. YQC-5]
MTQAVTFDDVWRMLQEMITENREQRRADQEQRRADQEQRRADQEQRHADLEQRRADQEQRRADQEQQRRADQEQRRADQERWEKFDRNTHEIDRHLKETAKLMRENAKQMQETDRKMQETDRKMQETDRKMKETDRKMKETDRKIGQLGGRLGEFVEGLVAPACKTLFAERGIPVHKVSRRVEADLPGNRHIEIDLFVVNTDAASLVEVKSKLTIEDVRDHMTRLGEFKDFFPEYSDKRVIGAVAGMVIDDHVIRFAIQNGLFVIVQAGDQVVLANDMNFKPREW